MLDLSQRLSACCVLEWPYSSYTLATSPAEGLSAHWRIVAARWRCENLLNIGFQKQLLDACCAFGGHMVSASKPIFLQFRRGISPLVWRSAWSTVQRGVVDPQLCGVWTANPTNPLPI